MATYDPSIPDGTNRSLEIAISPDGTPEMNHIYTIEARCGVAVRVGLNQQLTIINPTGHQVCDFWIFAADDMGEYSSMEHLHTALNSIFPKVGDGVISNQRRKLMTIIEDTSVGVHDTIIACCDNARYQQLGCTEYHDNCADNLRQALIAISLKAPTIPAPFNLWMNVPLQANGSTSFSAPLSKPGDQMTFRADMDVIAVMSACPQDVTPVNGVGVAPDILEFYVTAT